MIRLADKELLYQITAPGTATSVVVSDGAGVDVGTYEVVESKVSIPKEDINLYDIYRLAWDTGINTSAERVQRRYLEAADITRFVSGLDESVDIEETISTVEGLFERTAGRSFCLKAKREVHTVKRSGRQEIILRESDAYEIYSVDVNGESAEYKFYDGVVFVTAQSDDEISVHYVYGLINEPDQLKRSALLYAASIVGNSNGLNPRATGEQNEYGFIRFTVAGRDGATGIPEVDAFLSSDPTVGGWGRSLMMIL